MPHSRKQTVFASAVAFAASALLSAVLPIAAPLAGAAPSAPPWVPDPNAANYSGIVFYDANGNVVTSGTNLSSPFAYAVATTTADNLATKASLAFANPQHGVTTSNWAPIANEAGPTTFSPGSSLPAGTPADIVAFAPTYPVVATPGANITSWLSSVGTGLDTTAGYANTIQVRLTDSGALGHGNPAGTYWETDIGFNTTSAAIMVDGTTVPANGWAQLYPFQTASTAGLMAAPASPQSSGTPVTLTASVTPTTAAGSVIFFDNGTYIPGSLKAQTGGIAAFTYTPAAGSHSYTASFVPGTPPGDPTGTAAGANETQIAGSSSSAVPYTITAASQATTTSLISSLNPSVFGQSVTFTATVAPTTGTGTPTGMVTFKDGTTTLSTVMLSGGMASLSTSALTAGSHPITATYAGDSNFAGSTGPLTGGPQVVSPAGTTTAVTSSVNPSVFGQSVTFTATVSPVSPGAGAPTGTVTFLDGATPIGMGTLSSGVATTALSTLAVGMHTITTTYPGDANFTGSTGSLTGNPQVVNKAATTTSVTSSANPSGLGQSVTFTATVSPVSPGAGTPTGTVTFSDGGSPIGMGTLSGGMATFSTSTLAGGPHTITASYPGDGNFNASTGPLTSNPQVVKPATTTSLISSPNPSVFGQSVTFTATVAPTTGTGTPTGMVTFKDGTTTLNTVMLSAGMASLSTSALAAGSHPITATYGGDTNFAGSTGPLTGGPQVVTPAGTTTSVTSSGNPSVFGQSVTFTATVTPVSPGAGTPTGTVTFLDGGTTIGMGTLSGGVASYSTSTLSVGFHTITTTYPGDGNFTGSTGSLTGNPQVVNVPPPPSPPSGSVSSQSASSSSPSGTATATNAGTTVTTSNGVGSFTLAQYGSNPAGPATFTSAGEYFDLKIASGSQFSSVAIRDCNLNGGNTLVWWNPASAKWLPVVGAPGPSFSAGPPPCVTVTLTSTTSPNLAQLSGTIFAVAQAAPGYWLVGSDGGVFTFGGVGFYGSLGSAHLNKPIVGMAPSHDRLGYWLAGGDGGVFTFGDATFYGSEGAAHLNKPVVAIAATADGGGYYLVAADGGVFTFGDAVYYGSTAAIHLNAPIVGIVPTATGHGYWLVAADGGVFTFGDATFNGSMGGSHLNAPIVGAALSAGGHGYYLVASDGGVFTFGDAVFYGSSGGAYLNRPAVGMAVTTTGMGYRLFSSDGGVFDFGDATYQGSIPGGGNHLNGPVVGGA